MRITLVLTLLALLALAVGCGSPDPVTPNDPYKDQINAEMEDFVDSFIYTQMPPALDREVAALGDYTDMTCYDSFGLPGTLPYFWSLKMCELFNGPNWQQWVHPYNPLINGRYLYDYFAMYYALVVGCNYMTYMVEVYENPVYGNNIDIPNVDEVNWPVW